MPYDNFIKKVITLPRSREVKGYSEGGELSSTSGSTLGKMLNRDNGK